MSWIASIIGFVLGTAVRSPWTTWWNQGIGPVPMPSGTPPVDYTQLNQAQLLSQFSDAIGPNGITPRSLRNLVASTITPNPGGAPASIPIPLPGWTTATRPDTATLSNPVMGYNYTLQQLEIWDNEAGEWVNPGFVGGTVPGESTFTSNIHLLGHTQMNAGANINGGVAIQGNIKVWLPKSPVGLKSGDLWNNGNTVSVVP